MHKQKNYTSGIFLVLLGLIFLIGNLGYLDVSIWKYWPVIFLFFGLTRIFRGGFKSGLTLLFWGSLFLVSSLYGWHLFADLWPLILIWFGLMAFFRPEQWGKGKVKAGDDYVERTAAFEGAEYVITSDKFKGGKVDTVFGGIKLDLRNAKLPKSGAELEVNAVFGAVEILVSDNYKTVADGTAVFGGWTNEYMPKKKTQKPVLTINGNAVFGGVEIK